MTLTYAPDGVVCTIDAPLEAEAPQAETSTAELAGRRAAAG